RRVVMDFLRMEPFVPSSTHQLRAAAKGERRTSRQRMVARVRLLMLALLLVYNVIYLVRHVPPHVRDQYYRDFSNFYSASRFWLGGGDPFDLAQVYRAWNASRPGTYLGTPELGNSVQWAPIYPVPSLVLLAPLAAMPSVPAHIIWLIFTW